MTRRDALNGAAAVVAIALSLGLGLHETPEQVPTLIEPAAPAASIPLVHQDGLDGVLDAAGSFTPLRLVPKHKMVVLGIVSTKTPVMENKAEMRQRVEDATRFLDLDNLAISPQCGFASVDTGNPISPEIQEQKLRLVVELANDIWGEA